MIEEKTLTEALNEPTEDITETDEFTIDNVNEEEVIIEEVEEDE